MALQIVFDKRNRGFHTVCDAGWQILLLRHLMGKTHNRNVYPIDFWVYHHDFGLPTGSYQLTWATCAAALLVSQANKKPKVFKLFNQLSNRRLAQAK